MQKLNVVMEENDQFITVSDLAADKIFICQ